MALKAKYKCSQTRLHNIATITFNYINQHQAQIALRFPIYTPDYIHALFEKINHAQSLPSKSNTIHLSAAKRIRLSNLAKPALLHWKKLLRFIHHAHSSNPAIIKAQQTSIGKNLYRSATKTNPNWKNLHQMLLLGKKYLKKNKDLLAPYTPASFALEYEQATASFIAFLNKYYYYKFSKPQTTAQKIIANNDLYTSILSTLSDIKCVIPRHQRKRFTFNNINRTISAIHIPPPASP